jgi:tetratricopeptide (TPR) repeat protein
MGTDKSLPTRSPEALRNFVKGRDSFQAYWGSGTLGDLEHAKEYFGEAERSDPNFALATFYSAVAENELRQHDSAIAKLEALTERAAGFLPETYLHLAYAYTKKYTDEDYGRAEGALKRSEDEARRGGRSSLLPIVESYRVFLYSVIGGRSKRPDREHYLDEAIKRGEALLTDDAVARLDRREVVLVETHNALGIAFMRRGELSQDPLERTQLWARADHEYDAALMLNPNAVRVLQNRGTLRQMQGDFQLDSDPAVARDFYREALRLFVRTLALNPHDQFPHYSAAMLCAKLSDWPHAAAYYESGRDQPGSVKPESWTRLKQAIETQDESRLHVKRG